MWWREFKIPEPICMVCTRDCERNEIVDTGGGIRELWCYCEPCDVETFHPLERLREDLRPVRPTPVPRQQVLRPAPQRDAPGDGAVEVPDPDPPVRGPQTGSR